MSGCMPSVPVSVLHMHGTADATIAYAGGAVSTIPYLSVDDTVAAWVERDGKRTPLVPGMELKAGDQVITRSVPGYACSTAPKSIPYGSGYVPDTLNSCRNGTSNFDPSQNRPPADTDVPSYRSLVEMPFG